MATGDRSVDKPVVSILIPAYNVEPYVVQSVESALAQSYHSVEVVVVNDGSTDGTAAALAPYRERIVYVEQPNGGLANARNVALSHATGDIVGLLDADDEWAPTRAQRCVDYLDAHPSVGFVTTDAWLIENDVPTSRRYYGDWHVGGFAATDQLNAIAIENFVFVGALVRRELFQRHGTFDAQRRRSEDYDLWIRFLLGGEHVGIVEEALAGYRIRSDSLSGDPVKQREAHLDVLESHLPKLWAVGAHGRPGDAYDVARRLEARGDRRGAARFYRLGASDSRLGVAQRVKQLAAAGALTARVR